MLSLWNPFIPVRAQNDSKISTKSYFDRLFEESFNTALNDLVIPQTMGIESKKNEDQSLTISIDVPGISEPDLSVEIIDNLISVKGQRKTNNSTQSVYKSFYLPEGYDSDSIVAELKNGVLNLNIKSKTLTDKVSKKISVIAK